MYLDILSRPQIMLQELIKSLTKAMMPLVIKIKCNLTLKASSPASLPY